VSEVHDEACREVVLAARISTCSAAAVSVVLAPADVMVWLKYWYCLQGGSSKATE
jgi:hypothetical protein